MLKQIFLLQQFFELLVAFGHKKQFQRKSILAGIFIKLGQKRIVGKLFQDQPGIVMTGQQMGQGGFAGANVSFNRNKVVVHGPDGEEQ